jgi:hypothetical protein
LLWICEASFGFAAPTIGPPLDFFMTLPPFLKAPPAHSPADMDEPYFGSFGCFGLPTLPPFFMPPIGGGPPGIGIGGAAFGAMGGMLGGPAAFIMSGGSVGPGSPPLDGGPFGALGAAERTECSAWCFGMARECGAMAIMPVGLVMRPKSLLALVWKFTPFA